MKYLFMGAAFTIGCYLMIYKMQNGTDAEVLRLCGVILFAGACILDKFDDVLEEIEKMRRDW